MVNAMNNPFKALMAAESGDDVQVEFTELSDTDLPEGDVLVRVGYSTLNYKDGLALNGNKGRIMRKLPMVPGIDLAGTVESSESPDYKPGDHVVVNGWGLSETAWGGYTQKARLKSDWLVPLPSAFDEKQAMAIGIGMKSSRSRKIHD